MTLYDLVQYIITGFLFGSGVAIPYGRAHLGPLVAFTSLTAAYLLAIPTIYLILSSLGLEERHKNKIVDKTAQYMEKKRDKMVHKADELMDKFHMRMGGMGFQIGLTTLSLLFGLFASTVMAYGLRVSLKKAMTSIGIGSTISMMFWWTCIGYIPQEEIGKLTLLLLSVTILTFLYGWLREKWAIKSVIKQLGTVKTRIHF